MSVLQGLIEVPADGKESDVISLIAQVPACLRSLLSTWGLSLINLTLSPLDFEPFSRLVLLQRVSEGVEGLTSTKSFPQIHPTLPHRI